MEVRKLLIAEFDKRVFEESYERIYRCISLIDEKDLWKSPSPGIPAIGNLILHLVGMRVSGFYRAWVDGQTTVIETKNLSHRQKLKRPNWFFCSKICAAI